MRSGLRLGLLAWLHVQVSTGTDPGEPAPAPLESERPARDRGFESLRFRSADDVGPLGAEGLALAKAEGVRQGSAGAGLAGHGSWGSAFDCPAKTRDWAGGAKIS